MKFFPASLALRKLEDPSEMGPIAKRRRALRKSTIFKLLLLLVMFEEKHKQEQEEWDRNYKLEREMFEKTHKRKLEMMMDYYNHMQEYYNQMDDMERCRLQRARFGVAALGAAVSTQQSVQRRLWVKNRSQAWWQQCNHPDFPDSEFHRSFRMSRATFDHICEELKSVVAKEDTMLRATFPMSQRVVICIWRLATK